MTNIKIHIDNLTNDVIVHFFRLQSYKYLEVLFRESTVEETIITKFYKNPGFWTEDYEYVLYKFSETTFVEFINLLLAMVTFINSEDNPDLYEGNPHIRSDIYTTTKKLLESIGIELVG